MGNFNRNRNQGRGDYQGDSYQSFDRRDNFRPEQKKHSGAKILAIRKGDHSGDMAVRGWNYSRTRGLITVTAFPYSGSKTCENKNGEQYLVYMGAVQFHRTGVEQHEPVLVNVKTGQFVYKSLGILVRPKSNYCGKFTR